MWTSPAPGLLTQESWALERPTRERCPEHSPTRVRRAASIKSALAVSSSCVRSRTPSLWNIFSAPASSRASTIRFCAACERRGAFGSPAHQNRAPCTQGTHQQGAHRAVKAATSTQSPFPVSKEGILLAGSPTSIRQKSSASSADLGVQFFPPKPPCVSWRSDLLLFVHILFLRIQQNLKHLFHLRVCTGHGLHLRQIGKSSSALAAPLNRLHPEGTAAALASFTPHLLMHAAPQGAQGLLEGLVLGLQAHTPLQVADSLVQTAQLLQRLTPAEQRLHVPAISFNGCRGVRKLSRRPRTTPSCPSEQPHLTVPLDASASALA